MKLCVLTILLVWAIAMGGPPPDMLDLQPGEKPEISAPVREPSRDRQDAHEALPDPIEPERADRPPEPVETPDTPEHRPVLDPEVPATCTEEGKQPGYHCGDCGAILQPQLPISPSGHKWGDWSDAGGGSHARVCVHGCGQRETEGHSGVDLSDIQPNCVEPGRSGGSQCGICHAVLEAQEEIPALGHDFGDWQSMGDRHIRECSRCGDIRDGAHSFVVGADGVEECTVCGELDLKKVF